jgi:polyferredoxin
MSSVCFCGILFIFSILDRAFFGVSCPLISLPDFKNGFQRVIKHMLLPQLPELPQNERHLTHILFPKSIFTGAQYVTLNYKIKCLSLAGFLLATPPIKL